MKIESISTSDMKNMMITGEFKRDLTVRDMKLVEEFLEVEVGCKDYKGSSVCQCCGRITPKGEIHYQGEKYETLFLTQKEEIILVGLDDGLKIEWKFILERINSSLEENGKIYDTKEAKWFDRRVFVKGEEPYDAIIYDRYQTEEGNYFSHRICVVMQYIADAIVKNGTMNKKDARYRTDIQVLSNEYIIKEYGSQKVLDEMTQQLDKPLFDVLGDPC